MPKSCDEGYISRKIARPRRHQTASRQHLCIGTEQLRHLVLKGTPACPQQSCISLGKPKIQASQFGKAAEGLAESPARSQRTGLELRSLTSHGPWAAWCFSWICQSSVFGSAQWCMVKMTGRVSRAPGGPQLTTGVSRVWLSSTGGLTRGQKDGYIK